MVGLNQMLSRQLGNGIAPAGFGRGTDGGGSHLVDAEGVYPEDLAGRKIDEPFKTGALLQGLQYLQSAYKIGFQCLSRIAADPANTNHGCSMHDYIRFQRQISQCLGVQDISLDLADSVVAIQRCKGHRLVMEKAVEKDQLVSFRQPLGQMRTNKTGATGYEDGLISDTRALCLHRFL